MSSPLVTIAIPSYNHAKYIAETIQSALDQSFQDFEILIVDDASTDNSVEIIKSFKDSRITLIVSKENQGVCITSNICIANAKGKYIALIASDDVMHKSKLEKQVKFLENNEDCGAVFSGIEVIDEDGKINQKKTRKYTKIFEKENRDRFQWLKYFFHQGNCLAATSLLAKTSALKTIGEFDPRITQAHDFDLWTKLCLAGYELHIIHEKLLKYRERENNNNLSSNTSAVRTRLIFDNEKILGNFLKINSLSNFIKIFPEYKNLSFDHPSPREESIILHYLIFQEACKNKGLYHIQFATNLIYNLLGKEDAKEILYQRFGFNFKEYNNFITQNPLGTLLEKQQNPIVRKILKTLKTSLFKLI